MIVTDQTTRKAILEQEVDGYDCHGSNKQQKQYENKHTTNIHVWTNDHKDIRMFSFKNILSKVILTTSRTNNNLVFYKSNMHKPQSNGYIMNLISKQQQRILSSKTLMPLIC